MQVTFRFFDNQSWGIYTCLQTAYVLSILYLFNIKMTQKILILASLISMMQNENRRARLIFTFFLCMMMFRPFHLHWRTIIAVLLSVLLTSYVPENNPVHTWFLQHRIPKAMIQMCIVAWMIYFSSVILYDDFFE